MKYILDPLREEYGKPIKVNSGYRSERLNSLIGGSSISQHRLGQAADITGGNKTENKKLFQLAQTLHLPFDQLILEYGGKWVHISYSSRNRRQVLHIA
jgi:Peptidase M15.